MSPEPAVEGAEPPAPALRAPAGTGIWPLAGPTMLSFALQAFVGFVSTIIVARLGSADAPEIGRNAVAATAIAGQVHFVAFAVLAAVTIGTTALVARAVGSGNWREADRVLRCSTGVGGGDGRRHDARRAVRRGARGGLRRRRKRGAPRG